MKKIDSVLFSVIFTLTAQIALAQTNGYIYVHLKNVNEENATNFSFTLKNSGGTVVNTFSLNDQPTANNTGSGSLIYSYDVGLGHGTGGDGQLWATGGGTYGTIHSTGASGTLYYRNPASSVWNPTSITNAKNVDGAYANQCVYINTGNNVIFYNNGAPTTLYSGGDATDVTANAGIIAISTGATGIIRLYSNHYTTTTAPAAGGTWKTLATNGDTARCDINLSGTTIAYMSVDNNAAHIVDTFKNITSLGNVGSSNYNDDIACDDNGTIYASAYNGTTGLPQVFHFNSGTSWTAEDQSGDAGAALTGGAGGAVFTIESELGSPTEQSIWGRFTDASGNIYWIDDDRIKSNATYNGNGVLIPLAPGTYTLTETIPSGYDLSHYNIYDPAGVTSGSVTTNTITFGVTAGKVAFGEYINEKLVPKAITLTCTFQYLQTFDASTSSPVRTYTYGSGTYGTNLEGTSYHYWAQANAHDGYYYIVKNEAGWFSNNGLTDHTGNNGYFLLVNASFAKDEFYRQRITNLVPGLTYNITFYAADASPTAGIRPNVTYGLQDTTGVIVNTATTGNITSSATWTQYTFTFTATTSTADLFLVNNNIGGNGNDIAIDDISINPVYPVLSSITSTPAYTNICTNVSYRFSDLVNGLPNSDGIWTSSNTSVATINPKSGSVSGIAGGTAVITYSYTSQIGCTTTASSSITVSAPPTITATDKLGGTMCLNQADSLFTNVTAGGVAPYAYLWTVSPTTGAGLGTAAIASTSATPTSSGSYTYTSTVTDAVGCISTASVAVAVSAHTAPAVSTTGPATCINSAITSLSATPTGGSGAYTYAWTATPSGTSGLSGANNTLQSPNPTPTAAGSYVYSVTVNDGFCKVSATQPVTINALPTVSVASSPSGTFTICKNGVIDLTSTPSGGTSPYSYSWSASPANNGLGVTNTQNTTAQPSSSGTYTYTVALTDANGCKATSASVTDVVTINNSLTAPIVTASLVVPASTCVGAAFTLNGSLTGGTANYNYVWSGPAPINNPTKTNTSATTYNTTANPTSGGNYTLTVTDSKGCVGAASTAAFTVNALPVVNVTSSATGVCNNQPDSLFAAVTGGSGTYTSYAWTHSVSSGTDFSTVTPATGVTALAAKATFTNFSAKTYTFVMSVTDGNGCVGTGSLPIAVTTANPPSLSGLNAAATYCLGATINLNATRSSGTSGYTFQWSGTPAGNGANTTTFTTNSTTVTTKTATPTAAGNYTYTLNVTDSKGCEATASTGVQTINPALTVSALSADPAFCGTSGTDQLFAIPSGGSGTYSTYAWTSAVLSGGGSTSLSSTSVANPVASISGASTGNSFKYSVTVTDNNGCTGSASTNAIIVSNTPVVTATATYAGTACAGQQINLSGSITTTTTSPYSYAWTPSSNSVVTPSSTTGTTSTTNNATATTTTGGNYAYGLLVVDANNCTASANTAVKPINDVPSVTVSGTPAIVCANPSGTVVTLTAVASGGSGTYSNYAWSGSGIVTTPTTLATTTAIPTVSGTYTVTVTDGNSCTGSGTSSTITVDQATPSITLDCQSGYSRLYENNGVSWTWTTTSGGRFYPDATYSTSNDSDVSHIQGPYINVKGNYTVTIKDMNGCTGTSAPYNVTACGIVLASNLLNVAAQRQGGNVQVLWQTANETAVKEYIVERGINANAFTATGTLKALNSTSHTYHLTDDVSAVGCIKLYYRIKQINADGGVYYSNVVTVNCNIIDADEYVLKVYPNPVQSGNKLTITYSLPAGVTKAQVIITGVLGAQVYSSTLSNATAGAVYTIALPVSSKMAAGAYFLRIVSDKWLSKTIKVIKN